MLDICLKAKATHYLSGPSARDYLDENAFREAGIEVEWMHYPVYPAYPQVWGAFEPAVSILDLLLNAGPDCDAALENTADPRRISRDTSATTRLARSPIPCQSGSRISRDDTSSVTSIVPHVRPNRLPAGDECSGT